MAIDFPHLNFFSGASIKLDFRSCFHMFFLDVASSKKHVNEAREEVRIGPMRVGQVPVASYGTTKCSLWQAVGIVSNIKKAFY